ncbi:MAG TPA: serine hydrolase [Gemmataceae bacterium]|nr:serine hydrolase [Gemmataceae bacterium]
MTSLSPLLALVLLPAAAPALDRIDRLVTEALEAWDAPGAAVVIVSPDRVIHLKGYGVREIAGKPVTPDTIFPLASCSKAFTTTLMAALADDGKLVWDDPVRKHLPDFHLSDPAADKLVTLRDLVAHRTGVASHDLLWYRSPLSQDELIRRVGKLPLVRPFRTELQYQTIMYIAAGHAAARAGGKPWAELIEERLLKPLGMSGVVLTTTEAKKRLDRAEGYRPGKDGKLAVVPWYEQPEPNAAGSVASSARDLAPWLQLHLNGGSHGGERLISEANLRETHTPQVVIRMGPAVSAMSPETQQISYGLGWVIQDYRGRMQIMHAGLIDGFRVHLTLLPKDGFAFAILANREGTRMNLALSNALTDLLVDLPAKDWNKYLLGVVADEQAEARRRARQEELNRREVPPSAPLEAFAGEYEDDAYGAATIRVEKDHLVWEWGPWKVSLEHYSGDVFRLKSDFEHLNGLFAKFVVKDKDPQELRLPVVTFRRKGK